MLHLPSVSESVVRLATASGEFADVRVCQLEFTLSTACRPYYDRTYARKPQVDAADEPLFAELAILRLAELEGFEGVWVDLFHGRRKYWRTMPADGRGLTLAPERQELLDRVQRRHGKDGGAWDVFAWRRDEIAFVESKGPGDRLGPSQRSWFGAALDEGAPADAFTVVEWCLSGHGPTSRDGGNRAPTAGRDVRPHHARLPNVAECDSTLSERYRTMLHDLGLTSVMDNTLRRVQMGTATYPTRVRAVSNRGLVSPDGDRLTTAGNEMLEFLDSALRPAAYPQALLD